MVTVEARTRLPIKEVPDNGVQDGVLSPEASAALEAHLGEYVLVKFSLLTVSEADNNDESSLTEIVAKGKLVSVEDRFIKVNTTEGLMTIDGRRVPFEVGGRDFPYSRFEFVQGENGHTTTSKVSEIAAGGQVFEFAKVTERMILEEAITKLKASSKERSQYKPEQERLGIYPNICIYALPDVAKPIIAGELVRFEGEAFIVRNANETIRCEFTGAGKSPTLIKLEWQEWPHGGYYGETGDEYGGEPMQLPRTVARDTIQLEKACGWQIVEPK